MPGVQEKPATEIAIVVNGEALRSHAQSLAALLGELGYSDVKVATAVNGDFVPAAQRNDTVLRDNDQIEVVAPRQGG